MPRRRKYQEPPWPGDGWPQFRYWTKYVDDPLTFVYVVRGEGTTAIKVGVAKDVKARIDGLQTGNPAFLEVLCVMPGGYYLEAFIHRELKGAWTRGEWFDGPAVEPFLIWARSLARRMIRHHKRTGELPDSGALPRSAGPANRKQENPVTVRFVKPNPKVPTEVAKEMRRSVMGCSRSEYLGPMHPIGHQGTPGEAKNSGH